MSTRNSEDSGCSLWLWALAALIVAPILSAAYVLALLWYLGIRP